MAGGGLAYRFWVILVNLILPPLAVALLAGIDVDFLINCTLFLLAVIPSHIHGFYISLVYFHRRKKVLKLQSTTMRALTDVYTGQERPIPRRTESVHLLEKRPERRCKRCRSRSPVEEGAWSRKQGRCQEQKQSRKPDKEQSWESDEKQEQRQQSSP